MGDPAPIPKPGPDTNRPTDPGTAPRPNELPPEPGPPSEIPVEEPPPDRLPDEMPIPNPDEVREPPKHV